MEERRWPGKAGGEGQWQHVGPGMGGLMGVCVCLILVCVCDSGV